MIFPASGRIAVRARRRSVSAAGILTLGALLSACVVGPNYTPPALSMPNHYVEAQAIGQKAATLPADQAWWHSLGDAQLDTLITRAEQNAPTLAQAQARVLEARALRSVVGAEQLPVANVGGEYRRSHGSDNVPTGVAPGGLGPGKTSNLWQSGFDASWELDVFGGIHRAVESVDANYAATVDEQADVMLSLSAELARNYVELRAAQQRIALAQSELASRKDLSALTQSLLDGGLAARQDMLRAKAQVADMEATIPMLNSEARSAMYRIAAVAGLPSAALVAELETAKPLPQLQGDVPLGLPSDLLLRRPDLRAAERRIAEANARIGVAQADLYPHFSLTGITGLESLQFSSFHAGSSTYYSIGPTLNWRIFDAGKIRAEMLEQSARTDVAAAAYRQAVFNALRNVESALAAYGNTRLRSEQLATEAALNKDAVQIAELLYRRGVEDFLPVLDADHALYESQDKLVLSERDALLAIITLYKSIGGGWPPSSPRPSAASAASASTAGANAAQ